MADIEKVLEAFRNIGRQARLIADAQNAAVLGLHRGFTASNGHLPQFKPRVIMPPQIKLSPDMSRRLDQLAERGTHGYATGGLLPPIPVWAAKRLDRAARRDADQNGQHLSISKEEDCFYLKLPKSATNNLLGASGRLHFGEWQVHLVGGGTRVLLNEFGTWADAALYVRRTIRAAQADKDGHDADLNEYAAVGEVPC